MLAGTLLSMAMVGAMGWWLQLRPALHVDYALLAALPMTLGPWSGESIPVDTKVARILEADFNLQRVYQSLERDEIVWLYIGYYGTQRGGLPEHAPHACYPGHGWKIEQSRTVTIQPEQDFRANELVVAVPGEQRRLAYFWYQSFRRTGMLGRLSLSLDHLIGRVQAGRADGALVRLSTPFATGREAEARRRLSEFARYLDPLLAASWPREYREG
jgi:EpsI family protein